MDAIHRQALLFVRFTAVCLMVIGLLDIGLYLAQCLQPKNPAPVKVLPIALNAIPFVAGLVVLFKAKSVAAWISEKFE